MKEYRVKVYENRTEWYNLDDELHRENGPAVEWTNGDKEWYLNGKLHREDGPAVEEANGDKEWWLNGKELTEQEFKERTGSYAGREVEIDGKTYILKLK